MTPDEALADMEEHGQDITEAKKFVYLYHLREEALKEDKQKKVAYQMMINKNRKDNNGIH